MWRRLLKELTEWADNPDRMVLLIEGVRQCGKTYILKELGRTRFGGNMLYVDFEKDREVHSLFDSDLDVHRIINELGIYYNKDISPGRTLIIFDEIQECDRAVTSLKYFTDDTKEYHVACAGSLIGLAINKESFPFGKLERKRLFPMTFLEFLRAEGEEKLFDYLDDKDPTEPISQPLLAMASTHFRNYYNVGGMPKAVSSWVKYHSIPKVTAIHSSILRDYLNDFSKHGSNIMNQLVSIWGSIPSQLMKNNRRMIMKDVLPRGRLEVFNAPLQWLENAGLIYCVHHTDTALMPLSEVKNNSIFKVYPCDVGLLRTMSGTPPSFVLSDSDEYKLIKGAMAETYAVCSIKASGYDDDICYWKEGDSEEIDVIISSAKGVVPVEVKYGQASSGKSLSKYCSLKGPEVSVLMSMNNASRRNHLMLPIFLAETLIPYLNADEKDRIIPISDPSLPFSMQIEESDWETDTDGAYSLTIPYVRHNRRSPSNIQVYRQDADGGLKMVSVGIRISPGDDVILSSTSCFRGRLSII